MFRFKPLFASALCLLAFAPLASARQAAAPKSKKAPVKKAAASTEADPMAEVRRTTAISLVTSLADEARNFRNPILRSRVQARAADALWETDKERARTLFRRAWEAAESADAESDRRVEEERRRQTAERGSFSIQLPPSLRTEVLRLAARRERALGEEFLARMDEARKEEASNAATAPQAAERPVDNSQRRPDPTEPPPAVAKRLSLAVQLLEDGDTERAIQFADPALGNVSMSALNFLARLRPLKAAAADERFAALLARATGDPASDANTVSLLSSYIFTPGLFVTFSANAGSSSNQWSRTITPPTDISPQLRAAFFRTAAQILLRPVPPADQDHSSSGRAGWYLVIARLLPLFDQFAPASSPALRTQLAALTPDTPERARQPNNSMLTRGLVPEDTNRDRVQETLNRLDSAKTDDERDAVYVDAAFDALARKDSRLDEFVSKIENIDLRGRVRAYVDYEMTQRAIRDKDATEALRLARAGQLTSIQRAWALTEIAKLLAKDEPGRATELLDEATAETKRIDAASPDRVRALVAIATQMAELDRPRVWEVMNEIVKASNAAAEFTGEDGTISVSLETKNMSMRSSNSANSFDLGGIFGSLAKEDITRAVELARSFQGESPRAVATLAIARAVLEKEVKK
ncbi:MAG TPA: hypothetical protein VM934_16650 [Pyrinomonadaceae bacterium]|nr:hypothetical protein [Pyrinomonadaceae bacterium]